MSSFLPRQYLDSFINYESRLEQIPQKAFKLDRMKRLLELAGRPQDRLRIIHVAGSKGKGSVCAYAAYLLRAAGVRAGLYTSPHLQDVSERIRVLEPGDSAGDFEGAITDGEWEDVLEEWRPWLEEMRQTEIHGRLTYFEALTGLSLGHFRRCGVEVAVMETGLGGRLDATNAADGEVCVITPVSLEHAALLGADLAVIAAEKAAIIKEGCRAAVVLPQAEAAGAIIAAHCAGQDVPAVGLGRDARIEDRRPSIDGERFTLATPRAVYEGLSVRACGEAQAMNAAAAVLAVEALGDIGLNAENARHGLAQAFWPGRFEIAGRSPWVVLDCAHTPEACEQLVRTLGEVLPLRKVILVIGFSRDKDRLKMGQRLDLIAGEVIAARAGHARAAAMSADEAAEFFPEKPFTDGGPVADALALAMDRARPDDIILVTGSVFVVGEAREQLKKQSVNFEV